VQEVRHGQLAIRGQKGVQILGQATTIPKFIQSIWELCGLSRFSDQQVRCIDENLRRTASPPFLSPGNAEPWP
jgi:hypothetical protein